MKYSIILPVRNGGHYVKECVAGILAQSYADFNFIVLDNCSTDGTLEWLRSLTDSRITIIPADRPLTIEENWGRVVDVPKNEYMTLIGHDDLLTPDFLETIDRLTFEFPDASLFHTHFHFIDAAGNVIRESKPMAGRYDGAGFLQQLLHNQIDTMGTGYVMRAADYDALGGIPVKYPSLLFADFELWTLLASKNYIAIAPEYCFSFRIHQSTTHTSQDKKLHEGFGIFVNFLCAQKNSNPTMNEVIQKHGTEFLLRSTKSYAHRLLRTPPAQRAGISIASFINQSKTWAKQLGVEKTYFPEKNRSLILSKMIDSNAILRSLFLRFRKWYGKPVIRVNK